MRTAFVIAIMCAACGPSGETVPVAWTNLNPSIRADFDAISGVGTEAWALGMIDANARSNLLARWDGEAWAQAATATGYSELFATGPSEVWLVGEGGRFARWNGSALAPIATGVTTTLRALWGSSGADLWIAQGTATLLHWDGTAVAPVPVGTTPIHAVGGTARDDVWAVGAGIHHFDGSSWTTLGVIPPGTLTTIDVIAPDLAWATGPGIAMRWDGTQWTVEPGLVATSTWDVAGGARDDVWAVAGTGIVSHWDGTAWTVDPTAPAQGVAVWVDATATPWLVGRGEVIAHNGAACGWSYVSGGIHSSYAITGMWVRDDRAWLIEGGAVGALDLHDGCSFRTLDGIGDFARAIDGTGPDDLWIVGAYGSINHWDGTSMTTPTQPTIRPMLHGVTALAPELAWAVGLEGRIARWDGVAWTDEPSPTSRWLTDVWARAADDVWAVGEAGTIVRWDGAAWTTIPSPTRALLNGVWGADGDVWAVGEAGTLLHWTGARWAHVASNTRETLYDIRGRAGDDVWAVGDRGTVVHFDGSAWRVVETGSTATLLSVAAGAQIWVGGNHATVLRTNPAL